jgi:hypothetical protein
MRNSGENWATALRGFCGLEYLVGFARIKSIILVC